MIGELHYYQNRQSYDPVIPWKHSWATKWKKSLCMHKKCRIEEHHISFNAYWLDLYYRRDRDMVSNDENFEQYIIMQEI